MQNFTTLIAALAALIVFIALLFTHQVGTAAGLILWAAGYSVFVTAAHLLPQMLKELRR